MLQKEQLRKKIKQLKYKIDKQETKKKELDMKLKALKDLESDDFGTNRIFRKINFKLNEKGMDITDWLNCMQYDQPFQMDSLLIIAQQMGLHLDRQENDLLLNFFADDLSVFSSLQEFKGECYKSGIRLK